MYRTYRGGRHGIGRIPATKKKQKDDSIPFVCCSICEKRFLDILQYENHYASEHVGKIYEYQCTCAKIFSSFDSFKAHITNQTDRRCIQSKNIYEY